MLNVFCIIFFILNCSVLNAVSDFKSSRHSSRFATGSMSKIPKKIWQTYKTKELPRQAKEAQLTWKTLNTSYEYFLWDDADIAKYISENWDQSTYDFFKALPLGVMKADLWRYLIIATEGGIYSDIDSICCIPILRWGVRVPKETQHVFLLGLENDLDFCQWTIAATPRHPAMEYICHYIVDNWIKQGIDLSNEHFVHRTTGPGIWSEAISNYLGVPNQRSEDIYKRYLHDSFFRNYVNSLGIWIFSESCYRGLWSENLFGSQHFGDGYIKWTDERNKQVLRSQPHKI